MSKADQARTFEERFDALAAHIDAALDVVRGGAMPDLGDLDSQVAQLCSDVENADPEVAQSVQPRMGEMIGKLDELAQMLTEFQQQQKDKE